MKYGTIEQYGWKGYFRIVGFPKHSRGHSPQGFHVINEMMKLNSTISIEDLEVISAVGNPSLSSGEIDQPVPSAHSVPPQKDANVTFAPRPGPLSQYKDRLSEV